MSKTPRALTECSNYGNIGHYSTECQHPITKRVITRQKDTRCSMVPIPYIQELTQYKHQRSVLDALDLHPEIVGYFRDHEDFILDNAVRTNITMPKIYDGAEYRFIKGGEYEDIIADMPNMTLKKTIGYDHMLKIGDNEYRISVKTTSGRFFQREYKRNSSRITKPVTIIIKNEHNDREYFSLPYDFNYIIAIQNTTEDMKNGTTMFSSRFGIVDYHTIVDNIHTNKNRSGEWTFKIENKKWLLLSRIKTVFMDSNEVHRIKDVCQNIAIEGFRDIKNKRISTIRHINV